MHSPTFCVSPANCCPFLSPEPLSVLIANPLGCTAGGGTPTLGDLGGGGQRGSRTLRGNGSTTGASFVCFVSILPNTYCMFPI